MVEPIFARLLQTDLVYICLNQSWLDCCKQYGVIITASQLIQPDLLHSVYIGSNSTCIESNLFVSAGSHALKLALEFCCRRRRRSARAGLPPSAPAVPTLDELWPLLRAALKIPMQRNLQSSIGCSVHRSTAHWSMQNCA